jgi:hypothetical protein
VRLPSYLALFPRERPVAVYFLQWVRRGGSVDGKLTVVVPAAADTPRTLQTVKGKIKQGSVTLDVGENSPQRWSGERTGRRIVFADQRLTFEPATLAAYRRAVARLRGQSGS